MLTSYLVFRTSSLIISQGMDDVMDDDDQTSRASWGLPLVEMQMQALMLLSLRFHDWGGMELEQLGLSPSQVLQVVMPFWYHSSRLECWQPALVAGRWGTMSALLITRQVSGRYLAQQLAKASLPTRGCPKVYTASVDWQRLLMSVAARIAKAPPKPCPVTKTPAFLYSLWRLSIWLRTEGCAVRQSSLKLLETSQLAHFQKDSRAVLSQLIKVLMLSAPLKLTMMLLREVEQPVKPRTPLVRFMNTLGRTILYSEHSLQFQACMLTADSQAMADIQAISRATEGLQAAWTQEARQSKPRRNERDFILREISYYLLFRQSQEQEQIGRAYCMAAMRIQFICCRVHYNIDMSSPISFNNPSALLGRQQSAVFWKRMRRPRRNDFDPKNAQQNPIYRVMKNRRQLSPIPTHINSKAEPIHALEKGLTQYTPHFDRIDQQNQLQTYNKSHSTKQIESFKQKALKIVAGTKQFTAQLSRSKRKVNILYKFNRKVEKYCSYLPESPEEQTNESQHANEQLIQLCRQNFFPTDDLHKRVYSLLHYQEPHMNKLQRKELLKVSSLGKEEVRPKKRIQKMLTLNV